MLNRAQAALPGCLLLRFALADLEESQGNTEGAQQVYEALVTDIESPEGGEGAEGEAPEASSSSSTNVLGLSHEHSSLVWIHYMRFARRSVNATEARRLFIRARKWPHCASNVYVAAALMEYRLGRDPNVARKIFEKGLENYSFLSDAIYIEQYVNFLCDLGDVNNARALFERVLTDEANAKRRQLWERYVKFESEYGSIQAVMQVLARVHEKVGSSTEDGLHLALARYRVGSTWPCTADQRMHLETVLGMSGADGTALPSTPSRTPVRLQATEITQLPAALGSFINNLPPPAALVGVVPDADSVMDIILSADLSLQAIVRACHELEAQLPGGHGGHGGEGEGGERSYGGMKRHAPEDEDEDGVPVQDVYQQRRKHRAK